MRTKVEDFSFTERFLVISAGLGFPGRLSVISAELRWGWQQGALQYITIKSLFKDTLVGARETAQRLRVLAAGSFR